MTGARLTALRLVGFKSFAERTVVEFGPGISAVVGPNGSGKSNLADALRWTLGEQGRSLRTRRAEDVIFAGSSSRKAIGMADVTLVIDNSDRMLPVDFGELEIGRRLYRSGESEYLLNRQKIRLRDLVELLDAGNIADNAFLFIGQGMVDQALALRPEERRPLFEEAAGVRRHDRRRRQAETELAEAETNLERLRDLLGELRPQARRLAAQAEQLEARRTAGAELADALLAAARARWVTAYETERSEQRQLDQGRTAADAALATLQEAETSAATTAAQMASHAEAERTRRQALDQHRATIVELRVALARLDSEISALARETQRVAHERAAVEQRLAVSRASMSLARPEAHRALAEELAALDRQLSEAAPNRDAEAGSTEPLVRELAGLRSAHEQQAPRAVQLATTHEELRARVANLSERLAAAETERDATVERLEALSAAEQTAGTGVEAARTASANAATGLSEARERLAEAEAEAASIRARRAALEATLASATDEGLARAARGRGAKLLAEGVEIDPRFRRAVSAALDHAAAAFVVDDPVPLAIKDRRGALVLRRPARDRRLAPAAAAFLDAVVRAGGGRIFDSVRRDPQGELTRLLERTVWVADLGGALAIANLLPPGWRAVTLAGEVINDEGVVRLAGSDSLIEQRAELDTLGRSRADVDARLSDEREAAEERRRAVAAAMATIQPAEQQLDEARRERRAAEEMERVAQRRAEQFLREVNWERAQLDRLGAETAATHKQAEATAKQIRDLEARLAKPGAKGPTHKEQSKRLAALTARRDELARQRSASDARLAAWQQEQQIAQVHRAVDEGRLADLDREAQRASSGAAELSAERERIGGQLREAQLREGQAAAELQQVLAAGATDRATLIAAERAAAETRERLRIAEAASRRAEVSSMEARFQLEQIREQLLVELAGIGDDGLSALIHAAGGQSTERASTVDAEGSADESEGSAADEPVANDTLEATLDRVVRVWQETSAAEQPPSVNRVSVLRRRFHELGAGNPYAAEEYGELRIRLESLEAQRADLESAIISTRELIASLSALISEQFRSTFAALEDAFARRFHELFGGGDAQLSLTTPEDLSATGVEIHARPPGKKRQPLSMLSGGERALTAVSLLLAMLEVRPVPFCVLDEVDAALDEANVTRFSKALRGLAEQTQFIVITHNRGTIEGADALYGVTIGDDAVSRVVSLRLPKPEGNGEGPAEMLAEAALI